MSNAAPPPLKRAPDVFAIVANVVAILAAIAAFPYLIIPLIKLGFVGFMAAAPLLLLGYAVAFVVIDVGPLVGLVASALGVARWLGRVTGPLSLVSLIVLIAVIAGLKTRIDLDGDGHSTGPAPKDCKPRAASGAAVGRPCDPDAGAPPEGSCPAGYWCMEKFVGNPETTQCRLSCYNDCECPAGLRCFHDACAKR